MSKIYAQSGVDIEAGNEVVRRIKDAVRSTHSGDVLVGIGSFGGLFSLTKILADFTDPVLVQSMDGVGTKLSVARMLGKYDTVGADIVNHSCNDIVAMGARPVTFLDYVAHGKLVPAVMQAMVSGMVKACREAGVSLIGGETAEMPGVYREGEHDIAGCITGVVERGKIITGEKIVAGDILLGIASRGLQTNGFSLARKILFDQCGHKATDRLPGFDKNLGEVLLEVHQNFAPAILSALDQGMLIKGIAHITGGGFIENIPRMLPEGVDAQINPGSWPSLPIFDLIKKAGSIELNEMYKIFNMGIGMVLAVPRESLQAVHDTIAGYNFGVYEIGTIVPGSRQVRLQSVYAHE